MITKIRREILQCCPELVPQISGILCPVFVVIVSWSWQTPPPTSAEVSASNVVDGAFVVNCSKSSRMSHTANDHKKKLDNKYHIIHGIVVMCRVL
jgi:hypothetical protein